MCSCFGGLAYLLSAVSNNLFCNGVILSGAHSEKHFFADAQGASGAWQLSQNDESFATPKGPLEHALSEPFWILKNLRVQQRQAANMIFTILGPLPARLHTIDS